MPHIHTQPGQHDHTASAFVVRADGPQPRLLLHRHKTLGVYLQFGGHIELDETPWQAVSHELLEESGYELRQLQILQPHQRITFLTGAVLHPMPISYVTHAFSESHNHTDIAFAFVASHPPTQSLAKGESMVLRLVTRAELAKLPKAEIPENVREVGLYILDVAIHDWDKVATNEFAL